MSYKTILRSKEKNGQNIENKNVKQRKEWSEHRK